MAIALQENEQVFVPTSILEKDVSSPSAFYRTRVLELQNRSAKVDVGGNETEWVATSKCQRNIGIAIIAVGDLETERTLIDPLSKSILQFARILCSDDYVHFYKVRSKGELEKIWEIQHRVYSHVVVVGHGDGSALKFAVDGMVPAADLGNELDIDGVDRKTFINLSCELGKASYGKPFSNLAVCDAFIGPFHSVHGAIASHFVQSFLIYHLLHGETLGVAFRHARDGVAGGASFRMWRYGNLIT